MKPFNLEAAKRGDPCIFGSGERVKFIAHVPEANEKQRVIFCSPSGQIFMTTENGRGVYSANVYMTTKKKTVWINIYGLNECHWFCTREAADDSAQIHATYRVGNKAWPLEIEE